MLSINFYRKPQVYISEKNSIHPGYEQKKTIDETTRPKKPLRFSS
jgi:hypothetical protein